MHKTQACLGQRPTLCSYLKYTKMVEVIIG